MTKYYLVVAFVAILAVVAYFFNKGWMIGKVKSEYGCVVTVWNSDSKVMKLNCDGKSYEIRAGSKIFLTTYEKNAAGQEYEDVVMENGKGWSTAYCVNDKVTVVLTSPASKIEQTNIKEIRNRGPRYCKWLNS